MPYTINRYDGTELTVLEDGTINSTTSLSLIGKNYFGYGEIQNENLLFLLENFSNSQPPSRPISGQLWYDRVSGNINVYDGTAWSPTGKAIISESEPESKSVGNFWYKASSGILKLWDGTQWSFIGPENAEGFSITRAQSTIILDTDNNPRPVILLKVNNVTVAVVSSAAFNIKLPTPLPGFTSLINGITVSSQSKIKSEIDGVIESAKKLQIARLINGIPFNGQNDITIRATTTNKLIPGNYIEGDQFDGLTPETWNISASSANEPNKLVARNLQGDFSAGTVTANFIGNLSGNVTAPAGTSAFDRVTANEFVGGTFSGSSSTASRLLTPRFINGVAFDGTQDITVPASAQTLFGSYLNANIVISNLQQLGQLQFLSVSDNGIFVGNSAQKLRLVSSNTESSVYSETGILKIGASASPEVAVLNVTNAVSQGVPGGQSAIIPTANSNLGTPVRRWKNLYSDNVLTSALIPVSGSTITASGNLTVTGNLTIQGTVTAVNSTDVNIVDRSIVLASNAVNPTQADGAGIEIAGASASIFYSVLGDKWNINKPLDAGVNDISTTGLFRGTATSARYADLAENYLADSYYSPGTVMMFGGDQEVTQAEIATKKIAGVVSTKPAYLMNSELQGDNVVSIALQGRVPVLVKGQVKKGDMLISAGGGRAMASDKPEIGTVIGKALENFDGNLGIIEVVVGRI